jgi:hypothetical protein
MMAIARPFDAGARLPAALARGRSESALNAA